MRQERRNQIVMTSDFAKKCNHACKCYSSSATELHHTTNMECCKFRTGKKSRQSKDRHSRKGEAA